MPIETKKTPELMTLGASKDDGRKDYRQMCKYGANCYQKNPMHHQKFRHPCKDDDNLDTTTKRKRDEEEPTQATKVFLAEKSPPQTDDQELKNEETASPKKISKLDESDGAACSKAADPEILIPEDEQELEPEVSDDQLLPPVDAWPRDPEENIRQKFLVQMPTDFFAFWEMCKTLNRSNPAEAFLETTKLRLVGPFDLMPESQVSFKSRKLNDYLCHWRYYYDPPEFQTVLASTESNFHIGYFRDSPEDKKVAFVATSTGDNGRLTPLGDNLFGAMYNYLAQLVPKMDPFKQAAVQKIKQQIHVHASMKNQDETFSLEAKTQPMKSREKLTVASGSHGIGILVPYNKKTEVGYRPIPETAANLKKIFGRVVAAVDKDETEKNLSMDALQELVTNVQFANDEGDFGMGYELGLSTFLFGGKQLHSVARHLLTTAYELLGREAFGKILSAHLNGRRREAKFVFKAE